MRPSVLFHCAAAAVPIAPKSQPGFSAARLASAFSMLTNDGPSFTCTVVLPVVPNVANAPARTPLAVVDAGVSELPSQVPDALNGVSNCIAKNSWQVWLDPQNPPAIALPRIRSVPTISTLPPRLPVALRPAWRTKLAGAPAGYWI